MVPAERRCTCKTSRRIQLLAKPRRKKCVTAIQAVAQAFCHEESASHNEMEKLASELLQLCVFRLGLAQDRNISISVFPKREEVLIRGAGLGGVALHCVRASEL